MLRANSRWMPTGASLPSASTDRPTSAPTPPCRRTIGTRNLVITMGGVYRIPAMYARTRLAYRNGHAGVVLSRRWAAGPPPTCAIERLVASHGSRARVRPVELRRRNFVPPDAMPYKTANGTTYDCGEFAAVMEKALASPIGRASPPDANSRPRGTAARHRHGFLSRIQRRRGAPRDEVYARFDAGGDLHLYAVSSPAARATKPLSSTS